VKDQIVIISSLEKVFPNQTNVTGMDCPSFTMLQQDLLSFQVAIRLDGNGRSFRHKVKIDVESPLVQRITVQKVEAVPSMLPSYIKTDDNYLKTEPGLFPDLLRPLEDRSCFILSEQWACFWVEIDSNGDCPSGTFPVTIHVNYERALPLFTNTQLSTAMDVEVISAQLPKQNLIYTEWFHGDCIADFYNIEVFSAFHWIAMERQIALAAHRGINMMLTPIFTPPLDTQVGGERTTIQLVDIKLKDSKFIFNFENLERWVLMCQRCGITYFEMAHLYTQWGAEHCPKIMAEVDGVYKRIFGWDTDAVGGSYLQFLNQFLPELTKELKRLNIADKTIFHISDEPKQKHLEQYHKVKQQVLPYLEGFTVMDALSSYDFYQQGICENPIVSTNHVTPFIENHVSPLWVYYCCSQGDKVSNRFMAMPSARNRIIGIQLYKYDVAGFLHWGLNFYNSQYSLRHINPYETTDADMAFPSGDAFAIYPGKNGIPYESIRLVVFYEAINDLRALQLLEFMSDKNYVMALIEEDYSEEITFFSYPKSAQYLLNLRQKVNKEIKKRLKS